MVYENVIEGRYVTLSSANVDDAEFTLAIRQDPEFTPYLPKLDNTIDQQRAWIEGQRKKPNDYFFVIRDKQNNRIGTISIYDVEDYHAEAGRLAVKGNAFQSIEAQLLSFKFAFEILGLNEIVSYIYADNDRAIRFNKQFGGIFYDPEMRNNVLECKTINTKSNFEIAKNKIEKMLYR